MGYRRSTRGSKKSHHSDDNNVSSQKPGLWNCLVHHHNKSCNKGDHRCKLSRLTNKCRRLVEKISKDKIDDNKQFKTDIDSLMNLYSNNSIFYDDSRISQGKNDEIIGLINSSSPIHMSRFDSRDRIFDTEGEFVLKTYSCPPRSFDTINSKPSPYKTVIRKQAQSLRDRKIEQLKENMVPTPLNHSGRGISIHNNKKKNSFHQILNNSNNNNSNNSNKNTRESKISAKNSFSSKCYQRKRMTPPPPPEKPIQCFTKVWDLYEGYDKHVKEKEKAAGLSTIKEPLKNREQDNTYY